jgi:hypothetical protein
VAARDRERLSRNAPLVLLAVAMAAAAAVLLSYGSELTFFQDSWEFLMRRREFAAPALLDPHNEHIVLLPVVIELLSLRVFGMSSMMPELVVLVALLLGVAAVLFVYVRRRLGPWPALFAATLLLFLGPGWQDLLWPFQIGFAGAALFGIAALLALENEDRRWDMAACGFLAVSIAFSSFGLSFAVGAAVELLRRGWQGGLRRAYVVAVPLLLYAGWYAGWGHTAENQLSLDNVLDAPGYVLEGVTASLDSLLALGTIFDEVVGRSQYGLPLLLVLVALFVYWQVRRRPGLYAGLWPALAAMASFWFLAAANASLGREPYSSRYLYIGGLLLLLVAANLLRGVRLNRWGLVAAGAVTVAVAGFNLVPLREGRDFFEKQTVLTRSSLAAIEIASPRVDPGFRLPAEISGTPYLNEIEAGEYLRAVGEYGSPAYSPEELLTAPEEGRHYADLVLANALPLGIETGLAPQPAKGECVKLGGGAGESTLPLEPGVTTINLPAGEKGAIRLRRYARGEYPLASEEVPAPSTSRLFIPRDRSATPWRLLVEAAQTATVCRG